MRGISGLGDGVGRRSANTEERVVAGLGEAGQLTAGKGDTVYFRVGVGEERDAGNGVHSEVRIKTIDWRTMAEGRQFRERSCGSASPRIRQQFGYLLLFPEILHLRSASFT